MDGRRVSSRSKKYNPLFILFLCLAAAVVVLLIVSIALGTKLGSANKKLKASEAEVKQLNETVAQLEQDLSDAKKLPEPALPSANDRTDTSSQQPTQDGTDANWLDLSGHDEVEFKPTTLLAGYETYYTTAGVNLRSGPATSYKRIMTVDYGTKVDVAAREGGWSFVRVGDKFGWLSSDYLSETEPGGRSEATSGSIRR